MSFLQDLLSSVFNREGQDDANLDGRSIAELCDALMSERGEMSGNRLAHSLLTRFESSDESAQLEFFHLLLDRYDINANHVLRAAQRYADETSADHLAILTDSVEPRRKELLRRLNRIPGATGQLVRMREVLLSLMKEHPDLARIDLDFSRLFGAWFNRGFLVLREIDWHTPANILEKIIEYEAVHAITDWPSLRSRLQPTDRKCFAFFHPAMLDEPLIFVEVALTKTTPDSIQGVLAEERDVLEANQTSTAVFYSISNCQAGLKGVSFGNFLIKQVAAELSAQLPNLTEFRTLSPIPSLMRWIHSLDADVGEGTELYEHGEAVLAATVIAAGDDAMELSDDIDDKLKAMTAHYLTAETRSDNQPLDPVARFHLGNGASLDQILAFGDTSEKGATQSASLMVSYLYDLDRVIANHEAYARQRTVVTSSTVNAYLTQAKKARKRMAS
ncbi:MAG: malonyl-CoA decarboxylase [Gammaproteobacteria bacterium]|nr:malonyl-CoA decarboxylase [Gammaproteobacteria bacterium]